MHRKEVRYFYDGWRVIEEQDETGATLATYVYGDYIDEVLSMRRDVDGDGTPEDYFFHTDDMYNVVAVTNASGVVVERYEYGDFGSPEYLDHNGQPTYQQVSAIGNPYLFTGRRIDPETGLYYYRTRYLDPIAGRFTTRDRIGIWTDPLELGNGYSYVGNAPWDILDPYGLFSSSMHPEGIIAWVEVEASMGKSAAELIGGLIAAGIDAAVAKKLVEQQLNKPQDTPEPPPPDLPKPPPIPVDPEKPEKPNQPVEAPKCPTDPTEPPGPDWEWRPPGTKPGSSQGAWYNKDTKEHLHPDFNHPGDPPHYDYKDPKGKEWRIYPSDDGEQEVKPKKDWRRGYKKRKKGGSRKRGSAVIPPMPMPRA